jgi:hypothetical protein
MSETSVPAYQTLRCHISPDTTVRASNLIIPNDVLVTSKRVKLSLCSIEHHTMKMHGGVEVELRAFLISALHKGEW